MLNKVTALLNRVFTPYPLPPMSAAEKLDRAHFHLNRMECHLLAARHAQKNGHLQILVFELDQMKKGLATCIEVLSE